MNYEATRRLGSPSVLPQSTDKATSLLLSSRSQTEVHLARGRKHLEGVATTVLPGAPGKPNH